MTAMQQLTATSTQPRVCIEAHTQIDNGISFVDRMNSLSAIRLPRLQIVLNLRLRHPTEHYISYYLWQVVQRQSWDSEKFGSSFAEWAQSVPNLQSELLLSSKAAHVASWAPIRGRDRLAWVARWTNNGTSVDAEAAVWRALRTYTHIGTTERFDESNLVLANDLHWPPLLVAIDGREKAPGCAQRAVKRPGANSTWWCRRAGVNATQEKRRILAKLCGTWADCDRLVRRAAPLDFAIYQYATDTLNRGVREGGAAMAQNLKLVRSKRVHVRRCCVWTGPRFGNRTARKAWRPQNFSASESCIKADQRVMEAVRSARSEENPRQPSVFVEREGGRCRENAIVERRVRRVPAGGGAHT